MKKVRYTAGAACLLVLIGAAYLFGPKTPPNIQADRIAVLEVTTETGVSYPVSEVYIDLPEPVHAILYRYRHLSLTPSGRTLDPDRYVVVHFYSSEDDSAATWTLDREGITTISGMEGTWAIQGECPYEWLTRMGNNGL